ncbi:hypothetical protein AVEN_247167-1 [Araneus ventricosus]|uniref:Mos1 transposase HTH domain-containing protein n=1 Tax=Araneus ventricosus TaxID=182803 RepID=A0A4Y2JUZ3_ARAVE|nr:hypothetical protein AVEN_247167-1 [Araneus ventricosus]
MIISSLKLLFHFGNQEGDKYSNAVTMKQDYEVAYFNECKLIFMRRGACFPNLSQDERGVRRARCTIFRWCERYEAGRVNINYLPCLGEAHVVINSATISAVDELIRQNRGITTRTVDKQRNCASHNPQKAWLWQSLCTVGAKATGSPVTRKYRTPWKTGSVSNPVVSTMKPSTSFLKRWDQCINVSGNYL